MEKDLGQNPNIPSLYGDVLKNDINWPTEKSKKMYD